MKNQVIFDHYLKMHKIFISKYMKHKNNEAFLEMIKKNSKELALANSECKCEKCGVKINLQYHHLIGKINLEYMNSDRYFTQRNYWANIIILCKKHHSEIEDRLEIEDMLCISKQFINKVKAKYQITEKEVKND